MQILVVVANILMRTLKTEVEKGSMRTAVGPPDRLSENRLRAVHNVRSPSTSHRVFALHGSATPHVTTQHTTTMCAPSFVCRRNSTSEVVVHMALGLYAQQN